MCQFFAVCCSFFLLLSHFLCLHETGANGVGKSTLLNLLMGKLRPLEGEVYRNAHARIAMFAQHHVDGLDLRFSAVDLMMQLFPGNNPQIFRRHLG